MQTHDSTTHSSAPRRLYVHRIGHAVGGRVRSVETAADQGAIRSPASALRAAGYERHHVALPEETSLDLARAAVAALGELGPIDLLCHATALPRNAQHGDGAAFDVSKDVKALLEFPASHLQAELGLDDAYVLGVGQQACTGILGALRVAHAMLQCEPDFDAALVLTADRFPEGAYYEQAYHLVSDGAVATILSARPSRLRVVGFHGESNGALATADDDETVGSFFNHAHRVLHRLVERHGLSIDDLDWIATQNLPEQANAILGRVLGVDRERIASPTRAATGHLIGGDPLLNLHALVELGALRPGDRVALFAAGYGLHWQAALLEVAA